MKKKLLFNPFEYFAGTASLIVGIIIILFTSWLAYYSGIHYNGFTQVIFSKNTFFKYYLAENIIHWLIISFLFYLAGVLWSKSKVRVIDVF